MEEIQAHFNLARSGRPALIAPSAESLNNLHGLEGMQAAIYPTHISQS